MPVTRLHSVKRTAESSDQNSYVLTPRRKKAFYASCTVDLTQLSHQKIADSNGYLITESRSNCFEKPREVDQTPLRSVDGLILESRNGHVSAARRLHHLQRPEEVEEDEGAKASSDSSDYTDSSDEDQEYRAKKVSKHRENMCRTKQDILKKLEISHAFAKKGEKCAGKTKKSVVQRKFRQKKSSPLVKRQSLRLLRKDPNGIDLPPEPVPLVEENPRRPGAEFPMAAIGFEFDQTMAEEYSERDREEMKDYGNFMKSLSKIPDIPDYLDCAHLSPRLEESQKELQGLSLKPEHILKVAKSRIFSLAIHPSLTDVLIAAGDKEGYLGLWKPMEQDSNDGAYLFRPHTKPISCMKFSSHNMKLYSCSYDGQFRTMDLARNVFDKALIDDENFAMSGFDFLESSDCFIVSRHDGCLSIVDTRASQKENSVNTFKAHHKATKCVSSHPIQRHYVTTSHRDGSVFIFDIRNLSNKRRKPIAELKGHKRTTSSSYFSPISGKYILTTSYDNHLRIFDSSVLGGNQIPLKASRFHKNQTGRWLSSFRAVWQPGSEKIFVVGSMKHPRQIRLYDDLAKPLHIITDENLETVCPINCFHDSRNILAGGNSTGKVYLFCDEQLTQP